MYLKMLGAAALVVTVAVSWSFTTSTSSSPVLLQAACDDLCKGSFVETLDLTKLSVDARPMIGNGVCAGVAPACVQTSGCPIVGTLTITNIAGVDLWWQKGATPPPGRTIMPAGTSTGITYTFGDAVDCVGVADKWWFYDAVAGGAFLGAFSIFCTACP